MENNNQSITDAPKFSASLKYLKETTITFFKNPTDGIYSIFQNKPEKAFNHFLILYAFVFILYFTGFYIITILSDMKIRYIKFESALAFSLFPIILMFIVSSLSFGCKSIHGKLSFKNELITGGICGIPLSLVILLFISVTLIDPIKDIWVFILEIYRIGFIVGIFLFYIVLLVLTVIQQSLKASGVNSSLSWYLSPLIYLFSMYLTFKIIVRLF